MTRKLLGWGLGFGLVALAIACGGNVQELGDAAGGSAGTNASAGRSAFAGDSSFAGNNALAGSSASAGNGAASGGPASVANVCETPCAVQIFSQELTLCKLCHGNVLASSGLNLEQASFTKRLKDVPAKHGDLAAGMNAADCPVGDKLIDSTNPEASWLLKKITNQQGNCGTSMPSTGMLKPDQMACLNRYVHCVAAQ
jgi:hypothetical protein